MDRERNAMLQTNTENIADVLDCYVQIGFVECNGPCRLRPRSLNQLSANVCPALNDGHFFFLLLVTLVRKPKETRSTLYPVLNHKSPRSLKTKIQIRQLYYSTVVVDGGPKSQNPKTRTNYMLPSHGSIIKNNNATIQPFAFHRAISYRPNQKHVYLKFHNHIFTLGC